MQTKKNGVLYKIENGNSIGVKLIFKNKILRTTMSGFYFFKYFVKSKFIVQVHHQLNCVVELLTYLIMWHYNQYLVKVCSKRSFHDP
jgi:hypothetical protein